MRLHGRLLVVVSMFLSALFVLVPGAEPAYALANCASFTRISAGADHTLAVGPGGTVWAWGDNSLGQLGDGTGIARSRPVRVRASGLESVVEVSAGDGFSLALASDGTVWAWGTNGSGQLGVADPTVLRSLSPVRVSNLTGVTAISAGGSHALALSGGTVWAWGANNRGQLGDGTTTVRTAPTQVPALTGVTFVGAGWRHSLAVTGGAVKAWGLDDRGQLGNGSASSADSLTPVNVSGLSGVTAVSAGGNHSVAITAGAVKAWGENWAGQLGDGTTSDRTAPVTVPGLSSVTAIEAGSNHTVAIVGGVAKAWGADHYGQVGDDAIAETSIPSPTAVSGSPAATVVAAGAGHSGLVGSGGALRLWGWNAHGQIGDGTAIDKPTPVAPQCPEAPSLTSATDSPDPTVARNNVTFTVGWTDADPGDQVRAVICKTNAVSDAACPGGVWASGGLSATSPSTAVFTTSEANVGTHTYFAFACDASGLCSAGSSGSFTVTSGAPAVTSVTDTPDPVVGGQSVTFSVGWSDPNAGDQVRAVICKTDALSGAACSGGAWASGGLSATSPSTAAFTTSEANVGTHTYFAFACDASGLCSAGSSGSFTVTSGRPVVTSTAETPDPVVARRSITFSVGWSDPNPGDDAYPLICKTNALSGGSCAGGAWAVGSWRSTSPASATYLTSNADVGAHTYYAFVCDERGTCASASVSGTFTVSPAPACSDGVDNDGDARTDYGDDPGCTSIDDSSEGATCEPVAPGVIVCLTPGEVVDEFAVAAPTATPDPHSVAGYVDLYQFVVGGVTTTMPCVQLGADDTVANPCALAGGTFVSRQFVLVERTVAADVELEEFTLRVCTAEMTATVFGIGVNSAPAYALC